MNSCSKIGLINRSETRLGSITQNSMGGAKHARSLPMFSRKPAYSHVHEVKC